MRSSIGISRVQEASALDDAPARTDAGVRAPRSRLFWKLLAAFSTLSLAAILATAIVFSAAYQSLLERQLDKRLQTAASATAELFHSQWPTQLDAEHQALVRRLGERAGLRITLVAMDGAPLADSAVDGVAGVKAMENHRDRPEIAAARRIGQGSARRSSPTTSVPTRYHAVRIERDGEPVGVLRVALPLDEIEAETAALERWIWRIALLASAAALGVSYWIAHRSTEPLRSLAQAADALVAGRYDHRAPVKSLAEDELSQLARSLGEVGKQLAQRERQLQRTSQTQATVLEGMSEGVIAIDRAERVLFANGAAGRLLGFTASRVESLQLLEAVRSHELREVAHRALRERQLATGEFTWRGAGKKTLEVLATPLPGDPSPGVVLVLRDVSELKRAEQMRQQFIANVSHELKTPLSSIKAYTETLLGGAKSDAVHCERFLERIDEQANRLQTLILDMLSLARIESGQAALEVTSVPVVRVVRRCYTAFEQQAAAGHVSLENLCDDPTIQVRADEESLWQILNNLVDNAVKYTPADGRVSIRCRTEGRMAVIEVEDTGIGIPREHHERLFERFYRVDKARSRELGGTGLGLSIVKHLSQAMGGGVSVSSEPGQGSKFTVRLPLAGLKG